MDRRGLNGKEHWYKADDEIAKVQQSVKVLPEEKEQIQRLAKLAGVSTSAWCRKAIVRMLAQEKKKLLAQRKKKRL